jgi:MFS family permease
MTRLAAPESSRRRPAADSLEADAASPRVARRITLALLAVQSLGSAGSIGVATVAAIVGAELSGRAALAGAPGATYLLGAAFGALLWGGLSDRLGRRNALSLGLATGVLGAVGALLGIVGGSFPLLLAGLVTIGSGTASVQLGRFAAAEVHPVARRGRAVATVVLGGTFGSVVGPTLVAPTGSLASGLGWNELAGPYLTVMAAFALSIVVLQLALHPDPKAIGEAIGRADTAATTGPERSLPQILRDPMVRTAVVTVVLAHAVMVGIMQMTSLYMREHAHTLAGISIVFSSHTFGMFAFSVVTGWLADRWGRLPVITAGALITIASCLAAPLSPQVLPLAIALFGLGIGWNFCYVAGSALLSDALSPAEKARTQGLNDLLVGMAAASAVLFSGVLFAGAGYAVMGLTGALLTLPILQLAARLRRRRLDPARTAVG